MRFVATWLRVVFFVWEKQIGARTYMIRCERRCGVIYNKVWPYWSALFVLSLVCLRVQWLAQRFRVSRRC